MFTHKYEDIITMENLLLAWEDFLRGKKNKKDVSAYQARLAENLTDLHDSLLSKTYEHGGYSAFNISDPKPRSIHKATVRDRVLHRLIYLELYPYFDKRFIHDSYSCRVEKGTHKALDRFRYFAREVSKNYTKPCWVLKCDIKKFFASLDQEVLIRILSRHIGDENLIRLIQKILSSFSTTEPGIGLPLGNLTSQLLVNVYMHEFDMFVKQGLRVKYYIRYADDFVILSSERQSLEDVLNKLHKFLTNRLHLRLHEHKVHMKSYYSGVDFLGWVHFPYHRQIRTSTKSKIIRRMRGYPKNGAINSYRGLLSKGNAYKFQKEIGIKS